MNDAKELQEIYTLLTENYVEDDDRGWEVGSVVVSPSSLPGFVSPNSGDFWIGETEKSPAKKQDSMFRFDYSTDFLQWALKPPGYLRRGDLW